MEETPLRKKIFYGSILFVGIFGIGISSGYVIDNFQKNKSNLASVASSNEKEANLSENSPEHPTLPPEIKLTFTGDISLSGTVKNHVKNKLDGDYGKIFGASIPILQKSEITFGSFNGTFGINDSARTDTKAVVALREVGFDILGMNYSGRDRSVKNLIESTLIIDGNGLLHTGPARSYAEAREPKIINKNGLSIGYLAFTDNKTDWPLATEDNAGLLSANDPQLEEIIAEAKAKSDILVISFTWADKAKEHTLRQELLAHTAIDAGANVIIGHYGNNLQDIEYYHGGLIAYNLGNLINSTGNQSTGIQGVILETGIRGGVINTISTYGVVQNKNGFIESVSELSVESLIREKGVVNRNVPDIESITSLPSTVRSQSIYKGPSVDKVAITIDDGWGPGQVKKALDILSLKNAKATFFLVGSTADSNKLNIIRAAGAGIELGNHTESHGWLTQMTEKQIIQELDDWQKDIDKALGSHYEATWFRPPFMAGFTGHTKTAETVTQIAKSKNLKIALWNVDPFSGISERADSEAVASFVIENATKGSIILLHFTNEHMTALPVIIDGLRAKGLEPVTLSELISPQQPLPQIE